MTPTTFTSKKVEKLPVRIAQDGRLPNFANTLIAVAEKTTKSREISGVVKASKYACQSNKFGYI